MEAVEHDETAENYWAASFLADSLSLQDGPVDGNIRAVRQDQQPNQVASSGQVAATVCILAGMALLIAVIGGYALGWEWTGFAGQTLWAWLELLVIPAVLALGGYLFTRSENRKAQEIADQRARDDRDIADQRKQDDMLQAYLDQMGQLLLDQDRPLRRSEEDDEVRTLARARTLTALARLDAEHNRSLLHFLRDSTLIGERERSIISFSGTDLRGADLILQL